MEWLVRYNYCMVYGSRGLDRGTITNFFLVNITLPVWWPNQYETLYMQLL